MENNNTRLKGRPAMVKGKRIKKIDVRFTEDEMDQIIVLEKTLGIKRTDLIRMRVLNASAQLVINANDLIVRLDQAGADLGRVGNNINQLAKYANTLNKRGLLSPQIIERFNLLFQQYIIAQQLLEKVLRQVIRAMGH
jgi:hypothetical protein